METVTLYQLVNAGQEVEAVELSEGAAQAYQESHARLNPEDPPLRIVQGVVSLPIASQLAELR